MFTRVCAYIHVYTHRVMRVYMYIFPYIHLEFKVWVYVFTYVYTEFTSTLRDVLHPCWHARGNGSGRLHRGAASLP